MSRFRQVFPVTPVLLPVIHVVSLRQMLGNLQLVFEHGADGAFLIGHAMSTADLFKHYEHARREWPIHWIGLNCLRLSAVQVFSNLPPGVSGVWTDNAEIQTGAGRQYRAEGIREVQAAYGYQGLYFGGVAFKYQHPVRSKDLAQVARSASLFMDVVTTSGPGTGQAADPRKLEVMRRGVGEFPIGLASGVTPANARAYASYVDVFLVASSFTEPATELIRPDDFKALASAIKG